jgi:hypothetical protein
MTDSLHSNAISLQRAALYQIKQEANSSNIIEMKVMEKIVEKRPKLCRNTLGPREE